ncbi:Protein lifeguard 1 [Hondaea fermentalgiana]|uniref:Protein lifeguard 1 n=1 Tax=Hondaea fermentalgiana TaxID=2315210 RepID=A0A2R5GCB3_9STRA|nr:Protein lifeguard 1 [Hondaea fermentalgiana]|eukprot:GBG26223.1 Protein lifeguard 1 [Hondaea fermentalgiana]
MSGVGARREVDDLEANKPLRGGGGGWGGRHEDDRDGFVPTAEPVGGTGYSTGYATAPLGGGAGGMAGNEDVRFAEAIDAYDVAVRHGFVRKVFGILFVQLAVTFGWTLFCSLHAGARQYMQQNSGVPATLGLVLPLGSLLGLMCCGDGGRRYPLNYILLSVLTVGESLLLGLVAATTEAETVAMAVGTTVAVVGMLGLFATQTKYDFTGAGPYLSMALWVMVLYALIGGLFGLGGGRVYAIFGTLLFSAYLIYDVQLIVGGKHTKFAFGVDDYVLASISVYLDVINIFLYILELMNDRN